MKKIFLMVVILGLFFGCATTKVTKDFSNLKDWTDEELMVWHDRLDPVVAYGTAGVAAAGYSATKQEQRRAIRQELEARGYVYHPQEKKSAFGYSGYHPEWEKK